MKSQIRVDRKEIILNRKDDIHKFGLFFQIESTKLPLPLVNGVNPINEIQSYVNFFLTILSDLKTPIKNKRIILSLLDKITPIRLCPCPNLKGFGANRFRGQTNKR